MTRLILLIPHFNNPAGLIKSLASIGPSEQCDVLVVDDGSTRAPIEHTVARNAFKAEGELRFLNLPANRGIEHALNSGLTWITSRGYELIARLDCGDENLPDRFAKQIAFLKSHPDVMLLGGAASFVDQAGAEQFVLRHPCEHAAIRHAMRNNSAFIHPAVMFRTAALASTGPYPLDMPAAEDYALFSEFTRQFKVANLPDVLIRYELDPSGISLSKRRQQLQSRLAVQKKYSDGSVAALIGMARTQLLLLLPYSLVFKLKLKLRAKKR
ncbi:glycosyltransferase [Iodobacter arcticus]|uniref:Glycosyltransferase n=1 Tax=Iodobacter arcticus TaxID=590593 RepID=A0ABW2R1E1_9NEIS